jgi:hypothetical protein
MHRDPAAVRGWLIAIAANGCRARLRRLTPETTSQFLDHGTALHSAEQILERNAVRAWVQTALDRLPATLRTVILPRYISDASAYQTIAEMCDVPVGTVRTGCTTPGLSSPSNYSTPPRTRTGRAPELTGSAMPHSALCPRRPASSRPCRHGI